MVVVRIVACLSLLVGFSLQVDVKSGKEAGKAGNFMEDEQWLSTISQYSRKIKHWNRFRDDDYIKNMEENMGSDETMDTTKDPCQNVKCSRHKVCVAQGYQRAMCVNRKKLEHRVKQPVNLEAHESSCKPCPVAASSPVCGSDGHNYASEVKENTLHQHLSLKALRLESSDNFSFALLLAPGTRKQKETKTLCFFFCLFVFISQRWIRSLVASCKDSIGWMFSKLDTNSDLYLDQAELAAINLDKYEVCIRPFFNSCDSYKDGKVSTAEWCLCFWREKPPCLAELERIQVQEAAKKKPGMYIPSCDEDGYYRKVQCDQSRGECWCVDQHGGEMMGTRIHGNPDCDEVAGYSGDFGSGVGWEDEEEKEAEDNGEEAEEEEEEEGEADDGGYIW
uniref:SPARC (osteonectin), cwcv and kazal like domains proteoglycan 2 n=1 Tax=Lates calcarifer TaxID=8187 RepID=A0A4W6F1J0_LATCA